MIPQNYSPLFTVRETQRYIKHVKRLFEEQLSTALNLERVSAPLFVVKGTGINDDLNGTERKVTFVVNDTKQTAEIVNSLAKWKRVMLRDYNFALHEGLYTDMNAVRPDEELDNVHSIYVDQWDWEVAISESDRNLQFLTDTVTKIYSALLTVEHKLFEMDNRLTCILPDHITFVHAEELLAKYPQLSPRQREDEIARTHGAVFIIGIGHPLSPDGKPHDGRAPDYDDWSTENNGGPGYRGLNGDIVVWNPVLNRAFELSSMGIRVDKVALERQLAMADCQDRAALTFHSELLNGNLPFSIGGGIGQSRVGMFFLKKAHIGEVQASIWPADTRTACEERGVQLL